MYVDTYFPIYSDNSLYNTLDIIQILNTRMGQNNKFIM